MVVYFDHGPCEGGVPEKPQVSKRTEGHGEILRTELNFPQDHKHDPKFHVGPNLQRMGVSLWASARCWRLFRKLPGIWLCWRILKLCALMSCCACAVAGPAQW